MIVKTIQRNVVESHDFKSEIATIDAEEMRYISSLLRNNYSDTILATVRETFANAIDANKEANSESAVRLFCPTRIDPNYRVRDFGRGLSEAQLFGLYTKYGRSTKRGDNHSIGGFGIGRFAPLSYTDSFTVTSHQDGTAIVISVYVDESGDTRFTKIAESKSTEANGIEISVAVKHGDVENFQTALKKVTFFCDEKFDAVNFNIFKPHWIVKNKDWGVHNQRNFGGDAMVVMGGIAYPLDLSPFENHPVANNKIFQAFNRSYFHQNMVLFFPVGSLSLHHSREALEYNLPTKNAIARTIVALEKEAASAVQKELDQISDVTEFFNKLRDVMHSNSIGVLCQDSTFTFNAPDGKKVLVNAGMVTPSACFSLTSRSRNIKRVYERSNSGHKVPPSIQISPISFYTNDGSAILISDEKKYLDRRAHNLLIKNPQLQRVYVVSEEQAKLNFLSDYSSSQWIFRASKVDFAPKGKGSNHENYRSIFNENHYTTHFNTKCAAPTSPFYYVPIIIRGDKKLRNSWCVKFGDVVVTEVYTFTKLARTMKELGVEIPMVYGVLDTTDLPDFAINLHDVFVEKCQPKIDGFKSFINTKKEGAIYSSEFTYRLFSDIENFLPEDHSLVALVKKCENYEKLSERDSDEDYTKYLNFSNHAPDFLINAENISDEFIQKVKQEVLTIKRKYPMIFLQIDGRYMYHSNAQTIKAWAEYINLVDKSQS